MESCKQSTRHHKKLNVMHYNKFKNKKVAKKAEKILKINKLKKTLWLSVVLGGRACSLRRTCERETKEKA
jgi:hypothetical protein